MNRQQAEHLSLDDLSWVWVSSHNGKIRVQLKHMEGVQENTVWTWNAIGKQAGSWGLNNQANESKKGFLMNHLIADLLPRQETKQTGDNGMTNSDPITGQAAWYDLKVNIVVAEDDDDISWPQFDEIKPLPTSRQSPTSVSYSSHDNVNISRSLKDILTRNKHCSK